MAEQAIVEDKPAILDKFMRYHLYGLTDNWPNLHFEESGKMRLAHCAGFFRGLLAAGKDVAERFAFDLNRSLTHLNDYGGLIKVDGDDVPEECQVPNYRVVLGDDGTFGGFTLLWYRYIPNRRIHEVASELRGRLAADIDDSYRRAKEHLRVRDDLSKQRPFRKGEDYRTIFADYAFSFNGGLIYHGPGGDETFSVSLSSNYMWSTHT